MFFKSFDSFINSLISILYGLINSFGFSKEPKVTPLELSFILLKFPLILWMEIFLLIEKLDQIPYFRQYLYFSPCSLKLPPPNLVTHTNFAHRAMDFRVLIIKTYLLKYMGIILSSIFVDINHFCNYVSFKNYKI